MNKRSTRTKSLAAVALLISVSFVLSWLEIILSIPMIYPGIKIGLANIAIVFAIYYCSPLDAFYVLIGRLVLCTLLFGNAASFIYSASGGILSYIVMCVFRRLFSKHIEFVSIVGGVFHNIGQLIAACFVMHTVLLYYAPYLVIGGIIAGAFIGIVVKRILCCSLFKRKNIFSEEIEL